MSAKNWYWDCIDKCERLCELIEPVAWCDENKDLWDAINCVREAQICIKKYMSNNQQSKS
jgi:hypothetical protein